MAGPGGWGLRRAGFSAGVPWPGEPLPRPPPGPGRPPRPALPSAGSVAPPRRAFGGPSRPSRGQGGGGGAAPAAGAGPHPRGGPPLAAVPVSSAPQHLPGAGGRMLPGAPGTGGGGGCSRGGRAEPSAPHSWIPHSNFKSRLLLPPPPMGARPRPPSASPLATASVRPGPQLDGQRGPRRRWTGRTRPGIPCPAGTQPSAGGRQERKAPVGLRSTGRRGSRGRREAEMRRG